MITLPAQAASLIEMRSEAASIYAGWLVEFLHQHGYGPDYVLQRSARDGRIISVIFDALDFVRVGVSLPVPLHEVGVFADLYVYYHPLRAVIEALRWDGYGEPFGWDRHPATARRRPNGDAAREYIWA